MILSGANHGPRGEQREHIHRWTNIWLVSKYLIFFHWLKLYMYFIVGLTNGLRSVFFGLTEAIVVYLNLMTFVNRESNLVLSTVPGKELGGTQFLIIRSRGRYVHLIYILPSAAFDGGLRFKHGSPCDLFCLNVSLFK